MKLPNQQLGQAGEHQAQDFLSQHGFRILDTNVQVGGVEVDIVALDEKLKEVVFVEVKTRSTDQFGHSSKAVNYKKRLAMQKVARRYLSEHNLANDFRFDIICVWPSQIEHFENITW